MLVKTFYLFRKFICIFLVAFFSILLTFEANANILKDSLIKNLSFDSVKSLQTKLDKSSTDFILSQILNLLDHNSNKQAIKLINQIEYSTDFQNNLLFKANVLYYKSIALKSIGKLNESLQCNYVVLKIAENFKNHELMSKALNTMANVEANKGNYAKSIEYYFVSLKISENINDSLAIAKVYNNIALVYNAIKEYSKALSFLDNALKISVSMNNKKITASA